MLGLALAVALAACGPKPPVYDYSQEPDPRNAEYVLGIGDDLSINVWQNDGLNTRATIRPDGTITMPLVGDLKAAGETPSSLKQMIKDRLADFVKLQGSEITVAVSSANSYRFTVSGEVVRPGVFPSNYYVTVAEAIALAGGFTRFARRNEMVLMRRDPKTGEVRRIPLAYDLLASGQRPEMNLVLLAGDSLYVP
ncbi:MAG: polysaccharide biosynthesis/export family protein [Kofleriaceae bacterium]|nr:polysaccharide biosynthesis/export family protein [Myxococcales bacterium]MCB9561117.1 polysaccharide biosynthesis/export family protein [Kofleriaceae bacterium]MCB9571315.1 polysaccharide biosynthesis/export family protein [Kofleriaceae bacterium]